MVESWTEAVWFMMHEERMAEVARNRRIAEAAQGQGQTRTVVGEGYWAVRAALATALIALATRIAPAVAVPNPSTPALAE
jgi:hypothetical protein